MRLLLHTAAAIVLGAGAASAQVHAPIAEEKLLLAEARGFRLDGPFLHGVDFRSQNLCAGDFNGDGRSDFAVLTNNRSIIELFLHDADAENGFRRETVTLDAIVRSIVPVDVNGDGRTDLLATLQGSGVEIFYQGKDGRLQPPTDTPLEADVAFEGDIDGDKKSDVLLYRAGVFTLLRGQNRGLDRTPWMTFYTVYEPITQPLLLDLDGDSRRDILFQDAKARDTLVVRFQAADGTFPFETTLKPGQLRSIASLTNAGSRDQIVAVFDKTRDLMQFELADALPKSKDEPLAVSSLHTVAFDPETKSEKIRTAIADLDGDGRMDLVVTTPDVPGLRLLRQTRHGGLHVRMVPSLEGIEQVVSLPAKKGEPSPLLLFSRKERAAGITTATGKDDATLPFPKLIPALGTPKAMAVLALGKDLSLLALSDDRDGQSFRAFSLNGGTIVGNGREVLSSPEDIARLNVKDVTSIAAMDVNQDGRTDVAVFPDFKPAVVLLQDEKGMLAPLQKMDGALETLLGEMKPEMLVPVTLDGAKAPSVLAVKKQFARAFHLDGNGAVQVAAQFNGRNNRTRLTAAAAGRFRDSKKTDVALLDMGNRCVTFYGMTDAKEYEVLLHADLDAGDYRSLEVLDIDADGKDDLLLIAPDRVSVLYMERKSGGLKVISTVESGARETAYNVVYTADLLPGGTEEIISLRVPENTLEFFTPGKDAEGNRAMLRFFRFRMYETASDLAESRRIDVAAEPRAFIAMPADDKGRPQILALTHDFIIRYSQTSAEKK